MFSWVTKLISGPLYFPTYNHNIWGNVPTSDRTDRPYKCYFKKSIHCAYLFPSDGTFRIVCKVRGGQPNESLTVITVDSKLT